MKSFLGLSCNTCVELKVLNCKQSFWNVYKAQNCHIFSSCSFTEYVTIPHFVNNQKIHFLRFRQFTTSLHQCIHRHLAASPLFGGQIAGVGDTPRLSSLPSKRWRCRQMAIVRKTLKFTDNGLHTIIIFDNFSLYKSLADHTPKFYRL